MKALFARFASVLVLSFSGLALAAPQIIVPTAATGNTQGRFADMLEAGGNTAVRFNEKELRKLAPESEIELSLPNGTRNTYVLELTQAHADGTTSYIARHKEFGNRYRAIVTNGPNGSFAVFSTPLGEFRLVPADGTHDWLVDMANQPAEPPLAAEKDWILAPRATEKSLDLSQASTFTAIPGVNVLSSAKAAPTPQVTIDIMFVVTNGLAANLGGNLNTRMNFIVSRANTAYADSDIAITLRLARIVQVNYSDATDNGTALAEITPTCVARPTGFCDASFNAAAFGSIESQRTQAGADIVAFMRNGSSNGGAGLGWVSSQVPNANFMYSVTTGCVTSCESVVIHEIGHNMGNMHDRATVAWQDGGAAANAISQGAFPYSYGYAFCNSGALSCNPNLAPASGGCAANTQPECSAAQANNFSDIMAYFHATTERIYKFSNPLVTCRSAAGDQVARPCGVSEAIPGSANTALSMNNMRTAISALKPPGAGQIQFTSTSYAGTEGGGVSFVVSRLGGGTGAVSVQYATASGTATASLDFVSANGTLNWADGDVANKTIVVPITADNAAEATEAFTMTLSNPTGGAVLGTPTVATGTIAGSFPAGTLGGLPTAPAGWSTPVASIVPWAISNDSAPPGDADGLSLKSGALAFTAGNRICPSSIAAYGNVPCPTIVEFTNTFTAGTVSFAYRVNSFPGLGFLEFLVDGVVVLSASGVDAQPPDTGWLTFSTAVTAGAHTLRWQYRPVFYFACANAIAQGGGSPLYPGCLDRAWIDQVSLPVGLANSATVLGTSGSPSSFGSNVTFTATVSGGSGTPAGAVKFTAAGVDIPGCAFVAMSGGQAQCTTGALPLGANSIMATYTGSATYNSSQSSALVQTVNLGATILNANPAAVAFGGQSMSTTSPTLTTTITNPSGGTVTVTSVTASPGFAATHNCGALAPTTGTCTVSVTFTPPAGPSTTPVNGTVVVGYAGGATVVTVTGTAEKSLVTHYYRSILRRAPDGGGKAYWEGEAARLQGIGANINETWFAMAQYFYFSAEYTALNRDASGFVTDLYTTFFNRPPDGSGLAFWVGQINGGLPREVVLAGFMFSTEFVTFAQGIFGNTAARAEVNMVMDFYRGLLSRTPDQGGYDTWVAQFRSAQCAGAGSVNAVVESISSQFANGGEYTGKNRTNAQYVGDLYNSFLRRGGDLTGVQFWINTLNTQSRSYVRQQFIASTEFQTRVASVVNQGCLP